MTIKKHLWRFGSWCVGVGMWGQAFAASAPIVLGDAVWDITAAGYVDTRDVLVGDTGVLWLGPAASATLSGTIANVPGSTEGVIKVGAGSLTLSGANTFSGVTRVLQGELKVGSDAAIGVGGVQVNTGSVLAYAPGIVQGGNVQMDAMPMAMQPLPPGYAVELPGASDTVRWHVESGQARHAGVLSGVAGFEKTGAGRLSLDNDALAYRGAAVVKEGTLAVNELFSGSVQVDAGARLEGTGSIASVWVREGGTLAPGASIGVLRIPGDLRFDAGSILSLEVAPDGRHDTLTVGGQATLAGNVQALAEAGDWQPTTQYRFLTATGGLGGTQFDGVSSNFAFLSPTLSYDATSVTLTLERNDLPLAAAATTPEEAVVATLVDANAPEAGSGKALPQLYDAIVVLDREGARDAYGQLLGAFSTSVRASMLDDSRFVREAVLQGDVDGWGVGYQSQARADRKASAPQYERMLRGFTVGARHLVNNALTVGGFAGLQQRTLEQQASGYDGRASVQSVHAGVDLGWKMPGLQVQTGVAAEFHSIDARRTVKTGRLVQALSSAWRSRTVQWFGQLALGPLTFAGGQLTPFLEWAAVHQRTPGYAESGGQAALGYQGVSDVALVASLGLRALKTFHTALGKGAVQAELAWRYGHGHSELESTQAFAQSASASSFSVRGHGVAAHALRARVSVSTALGRQGQLTLGYSGLLSPGQVDHGVLLQVRHRF